jgi:hypothetical protein
MFGLNIGKWAASPKLMWPIGLLLVAYAFVVARSLHGYLGDDPYITFRVARNFFEGHGLVYNIGDRGHLATSGPLYALFLGTTAKMAALLGVQNAGWQIPQYAEWCSFIGLALTSSGLLVLFGSKGSIWRGALAGFFFLLMMPVHAAFGFEVLLQTPAAIWAYYLFLKGKRHGAAVLLALAFLIRPAGLLWVLPVLVLAMKQDYIAPDVPSPREKLRRILAAVPWKPIATYAGVAASGLLLVWTTSGAILPATFAAKRAQVDSDFWVGYGQGGVQWLFNDGVMKDKPFGAITAWACIGLLYVGYVVFSKQRSIVDIAAILLLSGCLVRIAFYATFLPFYGWYYVPVALSLVVLAATAVEALVVRLQQTSRVLAVGIVAFVAYQVSWMIPYGPASGRARAVAFQEDTKVKTYTAFGKWLKENTRPGESIGLVEVGLIGWYADHLRIVDQLGLVSPADTGALSRGSFQQAFRDAARKDQLDYIAQSWQLFGVFNGYSWFKGGHEGQELDYHYDYWKSFPLDRKEPLASKEEGEALLKDQRLYLDVWRRVGS